jgi:hypothetical protein
VSAKRVRLLCGACGREAGHVEDQERGGRTVGVLLLWARHAVPGHGLGTTAAGWHREYGRGLVVTEQHLTGPRGSAWDCHRCGARLVLPALRDALGGARLAGRTTDVRVPAREQRLP